MACGCSKPLEKFTIHADSIGQSSNNSFQVFLNIPLKTVVKAEILSVNLGSNVVTAGSNVAYVIIDELTSRFNDKTLPNVHISLNNESDPYKDLSTVDQRYLGLTSNLVQSNTIIYTQLLHGEEANAIIATSNVSMFGWSNIQTTNGLSVTINGSNLVLIGTPPDEYVNLDTGSNVNTYTETSNIYDVPQTGLASNVQSNIVSSNPTLTTSNMSNMQRAILKLDLDQTANGRTIFHMSAVHPTTTDYVYPIQQLEKLTITLYDERGAPITAPGPTYMTLRFHCARDNIYRY